MADEISLDSIYPRDLARDALRTVYRPTPATLNVSTADGDQIRRGRRTPNETGHAPQAEKGTD